MTKAEINQAISEIEGSGRFADKGKAEAERAAHLIRQLVAAATGTSRGATHALRRLKQLDDKSWPAGAGSKEDTIKAIEDKLNPKPEAPPEAPPEAAPEEAADVDPAEKTQPSGRLEGARHPDWPDVHWSSNKRDWVPDEGYEWGDPEKEKDLTVVPKAFVFLDVLSDAPVPAATPGAGEGRGRTATTRRKYGARGWKPRGSRSQRSAQYQQFYEDLQAAGLLDMLYNDRKVRPGELGRLQEAKSDGMDEKWGTLHREAYKALMAKVKDAGHSSVDEWREAQSAPAEADGAEASAGVVPDPGNIPDIPGDVASGYTPGGADLGDPEDYLGLLRRSSSRPDKKDRRPASVDREEQAAEVATAEKAQETAARNPDSSFARRQQVAQRDAGKILELSMGETTTAEEREIRAIVLKHLKGNNIEMLNAMYSFILADKGEKERGNLVAELRWEDLDELADAVERKLSSKKTLSRLSQFQSSGGKLREHKKVKRRLKIILERRKKRKLV